MNRKWTTIFAVFTLLGVMLAACQVGPIDPTVMPTEAATPQPTRTAAPTATFTPSPTVPPAWWLPDDALADVEIAFLYPWSGDMANQVEVLVDTFNQTNEWGIFVEAYGFGSARQVFLQAEAGLQEGNPPQVVLAPMEELAYWHRFDDLVVLDDFLNDATYGLNGNAVANFLPLFWEQDVLGGQRLGIPVERDARLLMYNQGWAQEMGFNQPPRNSQQFEEQACAAMQYVLEDARWQNNGTGGWIIDRQEYTILSWLNGFGIEDFPGEEQAYSYDQPETLEVFTYLRTLADNTCAWASRNPTPFEYFANREALLVSINASDLGAQATAMQRIQNEDTWTVIPYPAVDGEQSVLVYGPSFGILRSTPAQELAAWLFIRWMSEPFQQQQLAAEMDGLPVSRTLLDDVTRARGPQFSNVVDLLETAQPAPRISQWRVGRFVLPDAVYQIYQANLSAEQFPEIIDILDATIEELNDNRAAVDW